MQFIREYSSKVDELIKDKIEAAKEMKAKENEDNDVIKQQVIFISWKEFLSNLQFFFKFFLAKKGKKKRSLFNKVLDKLFLRNARAPKTFSKKVPKWRCVIQLLVIFHKYNDPVCNSGTFWDLFWDP